MLKESTACRLNRKRLASITISASSAHGLNPSKDESDRIRDGLFALELDELSSLSESGFQTKLNAWTLAIQALLPKDKVQTDTKGWGYARKFVNLFLGEVSRNHVVRKEKAWLNEITPWLEVPLDSNVAKGLRRAFSCKIHTHAKRLGQWKSIKALNVEQSQYHQDAAAQLAKIIGVNPIDLDLYLWRHKDKGCPICNTERSSKERV